MVDAGWWMLVTGSWMLVAGCWMWDVGLKFAPHALRVGWQMVPVGICPDK
jgi:hypothetical protein